MSSKAKAWPVRGFQQCGCVHSCENNCNCMCACVYVCVCLYMCIHVYSVFWIITNELRTPIKEKRRQRLGPCVCLRVGLPHKKLEAVRWRGLNIGMLIGGLHVCVCCVDTEDN